MVAVGSWSGETSELSLAHVDLLVGALRSLHELASCTLVTALFKAIDLGNIVEVENSSEGLEMAGVTVEMTRLETLGAVRDAIDLLKNAFLAHEVGLGVLSCRLDHVFKLIIKITNLFTLR